MQNRLKAALEHHQAGRLQQARAVYEEILNHDPESAEALHWLGVIAQQGGNNRQAIELIDQALQLKPGYAEAHYNLGFALQHAGQADAALASYSQAINFKPDFAEAYAGLGNVLKQQGRLEAAAQRYRQAISFKLGFVDAHNNLGNCLRELGQLDEAIACFRNALSFREQAADVHNNLGVSLHQQGRHLQAIACFQQALAIKPDYAQAHCNLGTTYQSMAHFEAALASFSKAIEYNPDFAFAYNNLGLILRKRGRQPEALQNFRKALALKPDYAEAYYNIHDVQLNCCFWQQYSDHIQHINAAVQNGLGRYLPFAFLAVAQSPWHELQCASKYAEEFYPAAPLPVWSGQRYQHDKIRIAYLSADFHNHATAYLMAGLFEAHDSSRFHISAISFGPDSRSEMRQRLHPAFDRFVDVRELGDREVALLLRQWEIDIAVDLKGYTTEGRPGILAQRPAPVQVSYLGYPGTLGSDYIDYILADRCVIPEDEQAYYTEKVVYLPHCYQVNDSKRNIAAHTPSRAELNLPETGFVFCCFNNNYKINPPLFDVWMNVLKQVEGSVLWLLETNPIVSKNLCQEAESRGVAADRLHFAKPINLDQHLARIRRADLFLDTLPYNAHTTASDALWAGLPVLTCKGNTFAGRVAASLLQAIDLPELISHDWREYQSLAIKLATDPALLGGIRQKLAANRDTTPLFDTALFCRNLEAVYTGMWRENALPNPADI